MAIFKKIKHEEEEFHPSMPFHKWGRKDEQDIYKEKLAKYNKLPFFERLFTEKPLPPGAKEVKKEVNKEHKEVKKEARHEPKEIKKVVHEKKVEHLSEEEITQKVKKQIPESKEIFKEEVSRTEEIFEKDFGIAEEPEEVIEDELKEATTWGRWYLVWLVFALAVSVFAFKFSLGWYVFWTIILALAGWLVIGCLHSISEKNWPNLILALIAIVILVVASYVFLPFKLEIELVNTIGEEVVGDIVIYELDGPRVAKKFSDSFMINLWKGKYNVTVNAPGFAEKTRIIENDPAFEVQKNFKIKFELEPIQLSASKIQFYDETKTVKLKPSMIVKGRTVDGRDVSMRLKYGENIEYGVYDIVAETENFNGSFQVEEGMPAQVVLRAKDNFLRISPTEYERVAKFITDYLDYANAGKTNGFPGQFYLTERGEILSLGDMIFLLCENKAFEKGGVKASYFIPHTEYSFVDKAEDAVDCYEKGLRGEMPRMIGNLSLENAVYKLASGNELAVRSKVTELNNKEVNMDVALTFNVIPRYVLNGSKVVTACDDTNYALGLDVPCSDKSVPYFTPGLGERYQYTYPWDSMITGMEIAMSLSQDYGIPITLFFTERDIKAVESLSSFEVTDLIEIGSLGKLYSSLENPFDAFAEYKESAEFLSAYSPVHGIRVPFYGKIGLVDDTEKAVMNGGFSYFSGTKKQDSVYNKPITLRGIASSPWMEIKKQLDNEMFVISSDDAWELGYGITVVNNQGFLEKDPARIDDFKAKVLSMISYGSVPYKLAELPVS